MLVFNLGVKVSVLKKSEIRNQNSDIKNLVNHS